MEPPLSTRIDPLRASAWIVAGALLLRAPMVAMPGMGRDEALYYYWSQHGEVAYAPLLQLLVRISTSLPLDLTVAARMPSIVAGLLALFFFERLLRAREIDTSKRRVALLAFALCPWQTYAGSILHPDDLQLLAVLGFAWALRSGRPWWLALAGGLALWAKPSGLLVSAFAALVLLFDRGGGESKLGPRRFAPLAVLIALVAVPLSAFDLDLLAALRGFGSVGVSHPLRGLGLGALGLFFLGGPLLIAALVRGTMRSWREGRADTALGLAYLLAFGVAAISSGQVKANWILPAALLLWPREGLPGPRPWIVTGAMTTFLLSLLMVIGFARPHWAADLEAKIPTPVYLSMAGERERAVSATRSWNQRLAEYQGLGSFCEDIRVLAGNEVPRWIVSDDYGLAAQWAASCPNSMPRLVLPLDPLFADGARPESYDPRGAMILAVQAPAESLAFGLRIEKLGTVAHPTTGQAITLARFADGGR